MRFSSSSVVLFAATAAYMTMTISVSAQTEDCITDLTSIFLAEAGVEDVTLSREYTLCPDTTFEVGNLADDGSVVDGQYPLMVRSNAKVKCGDDGSSANSCKIDGIVGKTGILLFPGFFFGEGVTDNIVFQGVTVDFFLPSAQKPEGLPPVTIQSSGGDITFLDCVFSTIQNDPMFLIDQYILETRRSLKDTEKRSGLLKMNELVQKNMGAMGAHHLGKTAAIHADAEEKKLLDQDNRLLQAEPFTVNFSGCTFTGNALPEVPQTNGGLALLHFRGVDPQFAGRSIVGTMNVNFLNNVFESNTITYANDQAAFRSVIDFYSIGALTMENNCFVDSDVPVTSTASTVTVVSGATVSSVNNFVSPSQADVLACPFVSEFDPDYNFVQCGAAVADATACGSDSPVAAPTIDAVLPSTLATLQSSGLDVEFILRWATNTGYAEFLARSTVQIGYPLTTFIPLDSAFQDNVDFWNDIIDNPIWFYHSDCAISYHLHLGTLTTPQWQYISTASTLLLETIALGTDPATGAFLANGQPLVDGGTDIATETGIIHYLDSPLIPRCLSDTIADFLINSSAFTILVELAGIAGLLEALEETRPLTLFAPTNDAFAKLDAATLEFLRNNPEELSEILLYHVYIGNLNISPEFNGVEVPTASNATFTLQVDPGTGAAFVNGESSVIAPNNLAFNGFLHAVDTVLMPPTVTPTTIAPVTGAPTTAAPVETTIAPVTSAPVGVTTVAPMTAAPIMPTSAPVTAAPIMPTSAPVTAAPTTASPVVPTNAPVTAAPVTAPPTSGAMTAAGSGMLGLVVASVMFVFM